MRYGRQRREASSSDGMAPSICRSRNKAAALERAKSLSPLLADMKVRGMSSRAIAAELTMLGIATPSGGRWHPQTVMRALSRAEGTTT